VATTIVLIAVFAPLLFLPGYIGRLFVELAAAIAAAVAFFGFSGAQPVADAGVQAAEASRQPGLGRAQGRPRHGRAARQLSQTRCR
jgi:hypothetical protein